ncbi:MAG: tetratricopeptide repeat protein [Bacteroidales bacterium]|nr:tetratricopeptide repeat protein [Bacteroidales bacterium]
MDNTLLTFSVKSIDEEILEKTLVGRKIILGRIENEFLEKALNGETYQKLIVAPRGSGKTHMIRTLYNRLKANEKLDKKIVISYPAEDEVGIASYLHFIKMVLNSFIIWKEKNSETLSEKIDEISDMPTKQQTFAMQDLLLEYLGKRNVLILVENLNEIFESMGKSAQGLLRSFMHEHNKVSFIATSQNLFSQIQKDEYPFYNFFSVTHLQKLTLDETFEFIKVMAENEKEDELIRELDTPEMRGKIRAVYSLTKGNHRLLVDFFSFLKADFKSDLSNVFIKTMNNLKPYYEQFIKQLPAQQQAILKFLSLAHTPQTGKIIAQKSFITPNTVSKQLSELYDKGYLDKHKEGKFVYYEIKEPLIRFFFDINEKPDGIVKLFLDFLNVLHTTDELKKNYIKYKYGARFQVAELQEKYEQEAKLYKSAMGANIVQEIDAEYSGLEKIKSQDEIDIYIEGKDKRELLKKLIQKAEYSLKKKRFNEAKEYYYEIIKMDNNNLIAFSNLGDIFNVVLNKYDKALFYYNKALKINPNSSDVNNNIGTIYLREGKQSKALEYYEKSISIKPNYIVYSNLAVLCLKLEKIDDAYKAINAGMKMKLNDYSLNQSLLIYYVHCNMIKDAKKQYKKVQEFSNEHQLIEFLINDFYLHFFKYASIIFQKAFFKTFFKDINRLYIVNPHLFTTFEGGVLNILVNIENFDKNRLSNIQTYLNDLFANEEKMKLPLLYLNVGIRHLKYYEKLAVYDFSKEEREVYQTFVLDRRK